ncbi:MAG: hypothetical protein AAF541_06110 [Pseudomonadota bacterium]
MRIIVLISLIALATGCAATHSNPDTEPAFTVHGGGSWKIYEVINLAALNALDLGQLEATVDFAKQRLVATQTHLRTRTEILVGVTPSAYSLMTHSPGIGNTFTQPAVIWMVVPKDERGVQLGGNVDVTLCSTCKSGAIVYHFIRDPSWNSSQSTHRVRQGP